MQQAASQPNLPPSGRPLSPKPESAPVAVARLISSATRASSALSIGLEPSPAYLPGGFEANIAGYERFLRGIIDATADLAAAFKFNLAFFESLGPEGAALLHRVRAAIPAGCFVIADAKRGDIGTTAEHYARALFDGLNADAATVNPLMGRDSADPFLSYTDRLTFFLVLTSNPGAADFLLQDGLYRRIARSVAAWNTRGNCGFVVGATKPEQIAEIRGLAGDIPFLVPGIGAQGGELEATARLGRAAGAFQGLLFHVTRGVLPDKSDSGDPFEIIRAKAMKWRDSVSAALEQPTKNSSGSQAHVGV
jgi:orotidine-5'-phosphate decarboxylase